MCVLALSREEGIEDGRLTDDLCKRLLDGTLRSCLDKPCFAIPLASSTSQLGIKPHESRQLRSAYSLECLVVSSLRNAGALLGYITWKRPKLALTMATAAAVVTAPYLGFAMAALNRWQVNSPLL